MTVKNNSNNESAVETQCIASLPTDTQSTADLQIRIRELEKEIARLHSQIKEQRYGLTWLDVPEAFETESENKIPILEEVKEKAINAAGRDALNASANNTPPHIIIEGDNYHALSCLNYTHRGKIDVIYIDPPYNTGNDGFTYKDKRFLKEFPDGSPVPKEHPLRHSYWLSFMSKRLELAKNLLSDKGVIFISIDNNELANLKLLCDKVFDESNFIEILKWKRKKQPSFLATHTASVMEYVLVYARNFGKLEKLSIEGTTDATKKVINISNSECKRHFSEGVRIKIAGEGVITAGKYQIKTMCITYLQDVYYKDGKTKNAVDVVARFSESQENIDRFIENNLLFITTNKGLRRDVSAEEVGKRKSITDLLLTEWGDNQESENEQKDIFGERKFDYAKPTLLVGNLIKSFNSNHTTILDFFAGSGTTLHATMKLNAEDGGHRQCILVQQREGDNNICENVTYERNRRVMCGYTNAKGEQVEGLGGRLKYYRTAFVGKHASHNAIDADRVELSRKAGYLLALGENTLEEIAHTDTYQIFADTRRDDVNIVSESNSLASCYTAIYFTENYAKMSEFVAEIKKLQASEPSQINVYIFCWGTPDIFESEFDDLRGISLKAIPQPILDVYKSINQ